MTSKILPATLWLFLFIGTASGVESDFSEPAVDWPVIQSLAST